MNEKFKSRKFIVTSAIFGAAVILPVVHSLLKIDPSVTMAVLGIFPILLATYSFANVKSKSLNSNGEAKEQESEAA